MSWQDVKFNECGIHQMIRFVGECCPVCKVEEEKLQLQNQVESLQMLQATAAAE